MFHSTAHADGSGPASVHEAHQKGFGYRRLGSLPGLMLFDLPAPWSASELSVRRDIISDFVALDLSCTKSYFFDGDHLQRIAPSHTTSQVRGAQWLSLLLLENPYFQFQTIPS